MDNVLRQFIVSQRNENKEIQNSCKWAVSYNFTIIPCLITLGWGSDKII